MMNIGGLAYSLTDRSSASWQGDGAAAGKARGGGSDASTSTSASGANAEKAVGGLSREEAAIVASLKKTDQAVRQHEMAHMAAGGGLVTSGASYTYERGPDGQNYAVAGEVGIDTSPGSTPEETIDRAQRIRAAALAPADPSGQDRAVAAQATQMEQQARMELASREASGGEEGERGERDGTQQRLAAAYGTSASTEPGRGLDTYA